MKILILALASLTLMASTAAANGKIVIGIGASIPPYVDAQHSSGVELDVLRASFQQAGYSLKPLFLAGNGIHNNLRLGRINGILTNSSISFDAHGTPTLYPSQDHLSYQNYAITLKSSGLELNTVADLAPRRIVAFYGAGQALGKDYRLATSASPFYRELPKQRNQVLALVRGIADVVIADRRIFNHFRHQLEAEGIKVPEISFHPLFPASPRRVMFLRDEDRRRFDQGLAALRQSGQYQQILNRHRP